MPDFKFFRIIETDEFLNACSKQEINDIIISLVDNGYLPESIINPPKLGGFESDFSEKLEKLKEKYYSLNQQEENFFNEIFKKYL